jgi:hypothetical protein
MRVDGAVVAAAEPPRVEVLIELISPLNGAGQVGPERFGMHLFRRVIALENPLGFFDRIVLTKFFQIAFQTIDLPGICWPILENTLGRFYECFLEQFNGDDKIGRRFSHDFIRRSSGR